MVVALLTDFGVSDPYVGIMHAVILGIAPDASIIDLTHDLPPQGIEIGAWALRNAWPYLPLPQRTGAPVITVAVIDPGVGTDRAAIACTCTSGRIYVGPDNGLMTWVMVIDPPQLAVRLNHPEYWLDGGQRGVSATFHGRDIFAPVAAHLVNGIALPAVGDPLEIAALRQIELPMPVRHGNHIVAHVIAIDHFGNLITDIGPALTDEIFAAPAIHGSIGRRAINRRVLTFGMAPPHTLCWYPDSSGHAAIMLREGNAAHHLRAKIGIEIQIAIASSL